MSSHYTAGGMPLAFMQEDFLVSIILLLLNILSQARKVIGDFGIPIAILVMVLIDFFVKSTYTEACFIF